MGGTAAALGGSLKGARTTYMKKADLKVRPTICSVPRCVVIVDPAEAGHYIHEEIGPDGPPYVTVSGSTRNAPVLSPSLSTRTPTLSSRVTSRFDIGVSSG